MPADVSSSTAGDGSAPFVCTCRANGVDGAWVHVAGELDLATAPALRSALDEALTFARLVVLDVRGLTFADCAGVHVVVDAHAQSHAAGTRLVLIGGARCVDVVFTLSGIAGELEFLDTEPIGPQPAAAAESVLWPLENPVNARVIRARVMAVADRQLWLQDSLDAILRVWAPAGASERLPSPTAVEVYLDGDGEVNGWWDPASGLAVNQRHLDRDTPPTTGVPMACQGGCGLVWTAPAAAALTANDEHCLTCAGRLAHG